MRRLRSTRFLSVVGASGSGKSSLVRSGLIPSLYSGFMVGAGSSWRVAMLRPGEDPLGHLAAALDATDVLGNDELAGTSRVMVEAALRRGTRGLVLAVRQARIPPHDNLLVIVDQFEELFRFRRSRQIHNSRDEAIAFVKLLLQATAQTDVPIYVVLTMRSDFIGDCIEYPGLPEAVNEGQYLVPRLKRDELRAAITGPVAVGGGTIAPRLVLRLLNDLGDDHDQLPVLQHSLMRTWDHWERHHLPGQPIDIADYEHVGTLQQALSFHAEEAYLETGSERRRHIAERMFKALTDTFSDQRGVRRPTSVQELAAICEVPESDVIEVVEVFRRPGRSFLMPPRAVPLTSRSIVDLSHESLMRCWTRLMQWAEEERASAGFYIRLSQAAAWFAEGSAGVWRNPELELGLRWRRDNQPTRAWANRYDESFDRAMAFLDESRRERDRVEAERERERKKKLQHAYWAVSVLATLVVIAAVLAYAAWRQKIRADLQTARAEGNLKLAREAVDETLSSADRDPARVAADAPQMQEFRRELLEKAKRFYLDFLKQEPSNEELRREMGFAHFRLGHINRTLEQAGDAEKEYGQAIAQFQSLASQYRKPEYRQALANAFNWLGETLRPRSDRAADAANAYNSALRLQEDLRSDNPEHAPYRQELARTHYNRGILRGATAGLFDPQFAQADSDFREAIRLLEPLAEKKADRTLSQELARAYNNLASLLALDAKRLTEARDLYERAIRIDEELTRADPRNRDYKLELATFTNNLTDLLKEQGHLDLAEERSRQTLALLEELTRPAPSLGVEQADAHTVRARILQPRRARDAEAEYQRSIELFEKLGADPDALRLPLFHLRFGDLLLNLSALIETELDVQAARRLLARAVGRYVEFASNSLASGSAADAEKAVETLSGLLPLQIPEPDRRSIMKSYQALRDRLAARK